MSALVRRLEATTVWSVVAERDVSYLKVDDERVVVVACDSHGGLGPKPNDTVAVDPGVLGRFALRVPLLELIAAGATPRLVADTLAVEFDPTGRAILDGIRAEAAVAGIDATSITGSTEENVRTSATGVGVTVIGDATIRRLRAGSAEPPFTVVLFGRPMSAPADLFGPDHPDIVTVPALRAVLELVGVREALPIGSRGVLAEFEALAASAGGTVSVATDWPCEADQSGGPSTAVLLATDRTALDDVMLSLSSIGVPAAILGEVAAATDVETAIRSTPA